MNGIIVITLILMHYLSAAEGGGVIIEWTRSMLYSSGFASFNKEMEISAVKARKSCTKLLRQIYEIGALDDSRLRSTSISYIRMIPSWVSSSSPEVHFPSENQFIYEQTKKILSTCNLGIPTVSVVDSSNIIKPPEMHILLDIITHAHQNVRIAAYQGKTEKLYGLDKTEADYLCIKLQALENMIHIIHELGENVILSNISIYELLDIFYEGLHEYQSENELLTANNVGEIIKIRDTAQKLANYELELDIQDKMLKLKQKKHIAEMRSKIQERNQSADVLYEWTQWIKLYYNNGIDHISELTHFGHRIVEVTVYDTIVALFDSISGVTNKLIYLLIIALIIIICSVKLIM